MADEVVVVMWDNRPFNIVYTNTGTKEDIHDKIVKYNGCIVSCWESELTSYIDKVFATGKTFLYEDKHHGIFIANSSKYLWPDKLERCIQKCKEAIDYYDYIDKRYVDLLYND